MAFVLKVRSPANNMRLESLKTFETMDTEYIPVIRSGGCADIGSRRTMEDVYICCDNFMQDFGFESTEEGPSAFYGVCSYKWSCAKFPF
jgi:protein phosphatase PTC2/3